MCQQADDPQGSVEGSGAILCQPLLGARELAGSALRAGTVTTGSAVASMTSEGRAARNSPAEAEPSSLLSGVSGLPPRLFPLGLDNFFFSILIPDYFTDPRLPNKIHMQLIKEKKAA